MNSNRCFVDTVCWVALLNKNDNLHETAETIYKDRMESGSRFVTTSSVLVETSNALCRPAFKPSVIAFRRRLESSPRMEIVFVDPDLWSKGWNIYETRLDKAWSLTDCISLAVMKERGISDALTSDRHFVQAGYRALLAEGRR
ncbi:MAG: type II toxin-antitoxin system VapC family toxin [Methanomicrobiales archaeon]|nr:type II toxin-antitoxin system VapC family toxin [Methanomicrobiales archaeon]